MVKVVEEVTVAFMVWGGICCAAYCDCEGKATRLTLKVLRFGLRGNTGSRMGVMGVHN